MAFADFKKLCAEHVVGQDNIEIVNPLERLQVAKGDHILAVPTLVQNLPEAVRKIIGDRSNTERRLVGLDIRPR
ncbi:MAG TPA: circadian clock KaiB family protein [Nitrospira sp.]|nr:circadian clock KaiB family protein [Nitrospira sp.]